MPSLLCGEGKPSRGARTLPLDSSSSRFIWCCVGMVGLPRFLSQHICDAVHGIPPLPICALLPFWAPFQKRLPRPALHAGHIRRSHSTSPTCSPLDNLPVLSAATWLADCSRCGFSQHGGAAMVKLPPLRPVCCATAKGTEPTLGWGDWQASLPL